MSSVVAVLVAVGLVVGGLALLVLKTAVKAVVEHEYNGWAPLVARVMVRFACRLHPWKADEWHDELINVNADGESGLILATHCLLGSLQAGASRLRARRTLSWRRRPQAGLDKTVQGTTAAAVFEATQLATATIAPAPVHTGAVFVSYAAQQNPTMFYRSHDIIQQNMEQARRRIIPPES